MPQALPFIGAGLGIYSAIKGGQQQNQASNMTQDQLAQQDKIRQMVLQRLTGGPAGNPQNPFSAQYGPIQPASPGLNQATAIRSGATGGLLGEVERALANRLAKR